MKRLLDNKVVFITGGTSGIGKATVETCVREGASLAFTGRNQEEAESLIQDLQKQGFDKEKFLFIKSDITKEEEVIAAVNKTVEVFGALHCVFANAGRHMVGNVVETTLEQWRAMFSVDVEGVFLTLKYTIPHLQKNKEGGSIVIMGSDQSLIGKESSSAYGAAKGAVGQLTKSTALDYAKDKIRINCVCPGTIDTPLAHGAMQGFANKEFAGDFQKGYEFLQKAQPIQRLGTAQEVSELVSFLLSDKVGFMTGSLISIDGGYVAG